MVLRASSNQAFKEQSYSSKRSLCIYQWKPSNNKLATKSCIDNFLTASSSCLVLTSVKLCHYCPLKTPSIVGRLTDLQAIPRDNADFPKWRPGELPLGGSPLNLTEGGSQATVPVLWLGAGGWQRWLVKHQTIHTTREDRERLAARWLVSVERCCCSRRSIGHIGSQDFDHDVVSSCFGLFISFLVLIQYQQC